MASVDPSRLDAELELLELVAERRKYNKLAYFVPYPKQQEHFDKGAWARERLFTAGNQDGKTVGGAAEAAYHLTGDYPDDWMGKRFDKPTKGWIAGETGQTTRDKPQVELFGPHSSEELFGTGYIPRDRIVGRPSASHSATGAIDTAHVRHKTGGVSTVGFKSYDQGRTKFQSDTLDFIWNDEEPPMDIYSEELARISATKGIIYTTFTSLKGETELVTRFFGADDPSRAITVMGMKDAPHFMVMTPEDRQAIVDSYPRHERDARVNGGILRGFGRVFITPEEMLYHDLDPFSVPVYWKKIWGMDFGIGHPFAASLCAWDVDNDVFYVLHSFKFVADQDAKQLPFIHAGLMRPMGATVPIAWPKDGTQREKGSGETLAKLYKDQKLLMLPEHATFPDGGVGLEPAILEMDQRMSTGRFKVARHLSTWWNEYTNYHRDKNNVIVAMKDDELSATRYALMMKRHAKPVVLGGGSPRRRTNTEMNTPEAIANRGIQDPFTGQ